MVMTMTAIDYDDVEEGNNAKLTYSIEKNVIDENTGTPIFEIEETTGVIKTAVCCLDREKTPDYSIQVVAMDGGGLKGTGTASIKVRLFMHAGECNGWLWSWSHKVSYQKTNIRLPAPVMVVLVASHPPTLSL